MSYHRWFATRPSLRLLLWLAALLAVGLAAQSVVAAHQIRTRGLPSRFPAPVPEANVSALGVNVALEQYQDEELDHVLTRIANAGFTWVRQSFYWSQLEPEPGPFDWTAPDRILAALDSHPQLQLVAVLDDSPPTPPPEPDRFAAFARAFAARYGLQVNHYQVWDEPNLAAHWGGGPINPPAYADLLSRTARAVRAADPRARILLAGLAPTTEAGPRNLSDVRYLELLYQAGAAPYFDVVAGKPYGFHTGPDDRRADEAVLNFSRLLLLREVMVEQGDEQKAVWASHWGWNALPPGWTGGPSIWAQTDEATQANRTVAALERARAEWPWVGALILDHFQPAAPADDPRWGFALVRPDDTLRPIYNAVADWAAALPYAAPVGGYPALNRWATYDGDWRVGPLAADIESPTLLPSSLPPTSTTGSDLNQAAFRFEGTAVALTVRQGPYRAFLYVTVDGRPANELPRDAVGRAYVVLYDDAPNLATVPLATGLPPGPHTVEVVAEGGHGQWPIVDWRVGAAPVCDHFGLKMAGLGGVGLVLGALLARELRRMRWMTMARAFLGWPEWAHVALTVALTSLLWATAGASWGRNWGSPWFVVSLLPLLALAAVFALRLDLGFASVAFTAPFYLCPASMLYRALSLPELLIVACGLGILIKPRNLPPATLPFPPRLWGREGDGKKRQGLDLSVLLLVVAALVSGLVAVVRPAVVALERWATLFELRAVFLLPMLYYSLLRLSRIDSRISRRIANGFVLGSIGVALIGLVQYALGRNLVLAEGGLPRLQSVYHSPNSAALYLGRVWPLLLAVALWGARGRRTLYALALAPVTLALVLSFSRGALLLGLPAALLVMGWRAGRRWRWTAVALVLLGSLALIPLLRVPRFASLLDLQRGSTFFRLELWRSTLALIREHPWFGVGPGNFPAAYRTRYVLPGAWQQFNLEHPHNIYLDHWARLGLLGVLGGLALQVAFWRTLSARSHAPASGPAPPRTDKALSLGLAGSMAALLVHGLVDNTLFFPDLALAFFLMLALVQSRKPCADTQPSQGYGKAS